jgi:beta-1,4-mannosyltransferase
MFSRLSPMIAPADPAGSAPPIPVGRRLKVCVVPFYADNPYQQELVKHLRHQQAEVQTYHRLKDLVQAVRETDERPDVVHLHWLPGFDGKPVVMARLVMFMFRIMLLRWQGIRIIWTVHNLYAHEGQYRWFERLFIRDIVRCASRLIVHSPTAAQLVRHEYGIRDASKIVIIPHGHYMGSYLNTVSRAEARRLLGLPPAAPVLLFLGKIRPYKGVCSLVRSFQALEDPHAILLVTGSPHDDAIVAEIEQQICSARVRLRPGYVPDDQVQLYMNAADAVVFPYQDVLTSGAVVLAMSFGRACIAARLGCICDVLDDHGALLYDPHQPEALQAALRTALADPSRLARMGQHNAARAAQWRWDEIAQATIATYRPTTRQRQKLVPPSTDPAADVCRPAEP